MIVVETVWATSGRDINYRQLAFHSPRNTILCQLLYTMLSLSYYRTIFRNQFVLLLMASLPSFFSANYYRTHKHREKLTLASGLLFYLYFILFQRQCKLMTRVWLPCQTVEATLECDSFVCSFIQGKIVAVDMALSCTVDN